MNYTVGFVKQFLVSPYLFIFFISPEKEPPLPIIIHQGCFTIVIIVVYFDCC